MQGASPSPRLPTSPSFFPSSAFESFAPSKAKIRNGVRRSMLIDYDTKLDDDNIPSLKLLLLGSAGVGKSALLIRYSDNYFDEFDSKTTIGIDLKVKLVDVDHKLFKVVLWDTAGQERYRTITPSLYKDTQGILLVYDINNKKTFDELDHWINECIDNSSNELKKIVFFVVGNKRDKPMDQREVFIEDLQKFSVRMNKHYKKKGVKIAGYYEVSAKYLDDVKFLFRTFISECVRRSLSTNSSDEDDKWSRSKKQNTDDNIEEEEEESDEDEEEEDEDEIETERVRRGSHNRTIDVAKKETIVTTYSCC
ncbi:Rab family GTPase [Saccharomycopsis crataegensis]|uniref:Rab family GTPase n=1 Tax=Saccharomycopsis crataegensis TaxID=43959 RepID=A0AAV5QGU2_9ASCO|nr:Rab family GTPase [Saccharomycopsis crataegensis]